MTIFKIILSSTIKCSCSPLSELEDKLSWGTDTQLYSIDPFYLIQLFLIAQIISRILSSINDNLYGSIIECSGSCTTVIHDNHLLV
jgi:hypothetical protein